MKHVDIFVRGFKDSGPLSSILGRVAGVGTKWFYILLNYPVLLVSFIR